MYRAARLVRGTLFMSTVAAVCYNPVRTVFSQCLWTAGTAKVAVLTASRHTLLMMLNAMVQHQTRRQP